MWRSVVGRVVAPSSARWGAPARRYVGTLHREAEDWYTRLWALTVKAKPLGGSGEPPNLTAAAAGDGGGGGERGAGTSSVEALATGQHEALLTAARLLFTAGRPLDASGGDAAAAGVPTPRAREAGELRVPDELCAVLWEAYHGIVCMDVGPRGSAGRDAALLARSRRLIEFCDLLSEMGFSRDAARRKFDTLAAVMEKNKRVEAEDVGGGKGAATDDAQLRRAVCALHDATTPLFARWMQQSAALPRGLKWLIEMRHDVLQLLDAIARDADAQLCADRPALIARIRPIEQELSRLLRDWFARSWLVMEELSWGTTAAAVLEQVATHEAVHPFASLEDVKARVRPTPQRHIFAFFHPAVIKEPLVMVQVALTRGISRSVDTILGRKSPLVGADQQLEEADKEAHPQHQPQEVPSPLPPDTAIFYSINSAQKGLKGIDLGNALIKTVAAELRRIAPQIKTFSTLSPIPGFRAWLTSQDARLRQGGGGGGGGDDVVPIFTQQPHSTTEARCFAQVAAALGLEPAGAPATDGESHWRCAKRRAAVTGALLALMSRPNADWCFDETTSKALEEPVLRCVAHYLARQKRRGRILDPVGNFHVGNGAVMHQLNYLANCTPRGAHQSLCVMVNYVYGDAEQTTRNATNYALSQEVAVDPGVLRWLS